MSSSIKSFFQTLIYSVIIILFFSASLVFAVPVNTAKETDSSKIHLKIITDEADQVLSILKKRSMDQQITDDDWKSLFSSEGYLRLKKREQSMKRAFTDEEFKLFVLSDTLLQKKGSLEQTLKQWKKADLNAMAKRALKYLPEGASIKAKIYPVIKPRTNSFVFEMDKDPAIFLFIDPSKTKDKFENTVTHELHHIGYALSCESSEMAKDSLLNENARITVNWIGAFGEGFAMLAAAGSPDIHPHTFSSQEDRKRWDKDVSNFNNDLKDLEKFFLDILDKKLTKEEIEEKGFSFMGTTQGPWYTVGYKMSVVIEKIFGYQKLIWCICNLKDLLPTYNEAAAKYNSAHGEHLAMWSKDLLEKIK
ncbi:MAG: DUF5700 domain-containing putative Zn-dependent protease [Bacteroidota bacterium]|nr:DUF5700 domain-containing putative Zn-dependent protease [Bacteroidota bacterium]MDP4197763.1 DUF5700 domain-containing putative Zn-dependent protease [Bacteroidota bacterium]